MVNCPCCDGLGNVEEIEDGQAISSGCYHCNATGSITETQQEQDLLQDFVCTLSDIIISKWRNSISSAIDCEDVAFYAAEAGLTQQAYLDEKQYAEGQQVLADLEKLRPETLQALLKLFQASQESSTK